MNYNILDNIDNVKGQIYKITNILTQKIYIGQTRTHYLNKGKYRPYGYLGRFNAHISEALCNTKECQSIYLNNSIRKHGANNFLIELLAECDIVELDNLEIYYIKTHNSLYPNGYNLTIGGKNMAVTYIENNKIKTNIKKIRNISTNNLISTRLKEHYKDINNLKTLSNNSIQQHYKNKIEKFKNVIIDINDLDKYLIIRNIKNQKYDKFIIVNVNGIKTKFCDIDFNNAKNRAYQFLKDIYMQHNQIDGNSSYIPIELSLPFCMGNYSEELS